MITSLRKLLLAAILLALTMSGCGLPGGVENNGDPVATSVAATMEALGLEVEDSPGSVPLPIVAYAVGGDVWISDRDGEKRLIYSGDKIGGVRIAPDGNRIVFSSYDSSWVLETLWEINTDGTNLRRLITRAELLKIYDAQQAIGVQTYSLGFIPGKNALAFSTYPYIVGTDYASKRDLQNLDLDSGALNTLIPPTGPEILFWYSPDGSKIAVYEQGSWELNASIGLVEANGGARREDLLTFAMVILGIGDYPYSLTPEIRWAEDSSRFRALILVQESPESETSIAVWEVSAINGSAKRLITVPVNLEIGNREFKFSPNLRYLLYFKKSDETTTELHILDLDQGEDIILYTGPRVGLENQDPWSPDSGAFLFSINGQLQLARLGSGYSVFPSVDNLRGVQWVDETSLLLYTGEAPNFQLDFIKIGSSPVTIVTLEEGFSYDVHK